MIEQIEKKVQGKMMEPGGGPWSSPAFMVPKKEPGTWRMVVDFRALNEATETDGYPLPRIENMLIQFGKGALFTVIDLKEAFHQVPLKVESRPFTCTSTPIGTFQWRVVVMGLKNGVAIFQRAANWCLRNVKDIAAAYVDDILIMTEDTGTPEATADQHEKDVRRVLEELKAHRLVADKKIEWFVTHVTFCGHVLGGGERRPAPGKLKALQKWEPPTTVTALRGFLGFTNYYATYCPGYGEIVAPCLSSLKSAKLLEKRVETPHQV